MPWQQIWSEKFSLEKNNLDIRLPFYSALKGISKLWFFHKIWKPYLEWYTGALVNVDWILKNLSEILIYTNIYFKQMYSKMFIKWWPFVVQASMCLTHCGQVTPYGDIDLGQHWLRWWLAAWQQFHSECPSYYLIWHVWNCTFKSPTSPRSQWVNSLCPSDAIWWHQFWSTLAQVMACCLMARSHYLNQFWLITRKVRWHWG